MRISLRQNMCPFSHQPGIDVWLPFTDVWLKVFPTYFAINDQPLQLDITGPIQGFTLLQDIEKRCVRIFGFSKQGYYQCKIFAEKDRLFLLLERGPDKGISYQWRSEQKYIKKKQSVALSICTVFARSQERLSLGIHKQQNWERILQRKDMKELLPLWYAAGQIMPIQRPSSFLKKIKIDESSFEQVFQSGFKGMFAYRNSDEEHLGIEPISKNRQDFISFLHETYLSIRELFFRQKEASFWLLPNLPSSCPCGRMVNIRCENEGTLDFMWSKKQLKKVFFRAEKETTIRWNVPLSRYRLQVLSSGKKIKMEANWPMSVEKGKIYCLDHFEK